MKPGLYRQLSEIEDTHWWFVHRRRLAADWLKRFGFTGGERALDVGCGTGGNMPFLARYCRRRTGVDISPEALGFCRSRFPDDEFIEADANDISAHFAAESFDLITVFNVLYHRWIKSEETVLRQLHTLLRPGGVILLTEPAFPILFRQHDRQDFGARRYRTGPFRDMLKACGYIDVRMTYFNSFAFLPALLLAALDKPDDDVSDDAEVAELALGRPWVNRTAGGLMAVERAAIKIFGRMPFGVGLMCVARRPLN